MVAWIPITIAAAFVQNLRFMLQKHLKATRLSTGGATLARFIFGAPFALATVLVYAAVSGQSFPALTAEFWGFAVAGGVAQILATVAVVALFALRNFSVGMTFKNTETLQTAVGSFLILGEGMGAVAVVAIVIGFFGLVFLAKSPDSRVGIRGYFNQAAGLGILSGALFAVSAIGYRGASLALPSGDVFLRASTTLAVVIVMQSLILGTWLRLREPGEVTKVLGAWRIAWLVGLTSMLGSLGWFTAFTLTNAAFVRAVGQVELIFSYAASILWFREVPTRREAAGIALLIVSIVTLIVGLER